MNFVSIDFWTLIFTWINLFILYKIMKKLLFKPIMNIMEQRDREVGEMYSKAETAQKNAEELEKEYPEEFMVGWHQNFGTCKTPGGESVPEVAERIYAEVLKIAGENIGKTVLIACHAAAIRSFWGKITDTKPENVCGSIPFPKNTSFSVVEFDGKRLIPVAYGAEEVVF